MTGEKALFVSPFALDPASPENPFSLGDLLCPLGNAGYCILQCRNAEQAQGLGASSHTFQMLMAVGETRENHIAGKIDNSRIAAQIILHVCLATDKDNAIV